MRLLTINETALRLGVRPKTLRDWIWQRKIEFVRIGRAVRVSEVIVDRLIERGTVPARKQ